MSVCWEYTVCTVPVQTAVRNCTDVHNLSVSASLEKLKISVQFLVLLSVGTLWAIGYRYLSYVSTILFRENLILILKV